MNKEDYIGQLIDNERLQLRDKFDQQKTESFNNLIKEKDKEIEKLNTEIDYLNKLRDEDAEKLKKKDNIINELEKELDNLIIFNQSNITCNHYTPDDWKDSKLIDNMLYKMKPISFLAQELKDKLKELKEGMGDE